MRINLHASGFDLTNYTRDFVQSRLLPRLGQFRDRIGSVDVNLAASKGRPDTTACEIVVNVHPYGEIRRRAEHEWMHVAIDRAASGIVSDVRRELVRTVHTAPSRVAGDRAHDSRIPPRRPDVGERPEGRLPPARGRERWWTPRTEEGIDTASPADRP